MFPVGFESTISAGERPQTHASDRMATGTSIYIKQNRKNRTYCATWKVFAFSLCVEGGLANVGLLPDLK